MLLLTLEIFRLPILSIPRLDTTIPLCGTSLPTSEKFLVRRLLFFYLCNILSLKGYKNCKYHIEIRKADIAYGMMKVLEILL